MNKNIGILQIGVGSMGKRRIRNLQYLGFNNISCYDIRADRTAEAKEKYGVNIIDYKNVNWGNFSHVIVSTPPDQHIQYAIDAIKNDKHVFIEASVVDDQYDEIIQLHIGNQKSILAPSCTMRFDPILVKAKEIIDSGKLGKPISANHYFGQYLKYWHPYEDIKDFYVSKKHTGASREIVPFDLVYLVWMFGDLTKVSSLRKNSGTLGVDIDDIYSIIAETNKGVQLHLTIDVLSKVPYRDTRIVLEKGNIEINNIKGELNVFDMQLNTWEHFTRSKMMTTQSTEEMYVVELKAFLESTFGGPAFPYSMKEDHKILKYLFAAEQANNDSKILPL